MEKQFLVTGTPSKLTVDMAHECLSKKHSVLLTLDPGTEAPAIPPGLEDRLQYVEWNRRSSLSARFITLHASNHLLNIEHAVVVHTPSMDRAVFHESNNAYIEQRVDLELKGFLFVVKEIIAYFMKQGSGSLTFLVHNPGPEVLPPLDALVLSGIEGTIESLFSYYGQESIVLRGVSSRISQNRQITENVMNLIQEDSPKTRNKMTVMNGKVPFFNFGKK